MPATLLFVFAHPDDESFAAAGTAMKYAADGARIVLVTATRGERGKAGDPPICTAAELPTRREQELRQAVEIIGFDEFHLLDYKDQELADAPVDEMRRILVPLIRRLRPAVVFTFDPNGFNRHTDHVAISRFTSDAIAAAGDGRWLPDSGDPYVVPRLLWTPLLPPWDVAALDGLENQPSIDVALDVARWHDRRAAALRAHRTQHLPIDRSFFHRPNLERILAREVWRQAWGPPLTRRPASDVLDGLSV